jgi:hypothetical protein
MRVAKRTSKGAHTGRALEVTLIWKVTEPIVQTFPVQGTAVSCAIVTRCIWFEGGVAVWIIAFLSTCDSKQSSTSYEEQP